MAKEKIPRHVKFVDEFPTTSTGKVQTFVMREQMVRELAREGRRAGPGAEGS